MWVTEANIYIGVTAQLYCDIPCVEFIFIDTAKELDINKYVDRGKYNFHTSLG